MLPVTRRSAGAAAALAALRRHGRRVRAGRRPSRPKMLRYAFPRRRDRLRSGARSSTSTRASSRAHIFEALLRLRPPGAADADPAADDAGDARDRPTTSGPGPSASAPASSSPTTRRSRAGARELVAADYVYALKRFFDPATKSPAWGSVEEMAFIGLEALREEALKNRKPFDYDREVEGLRALDRYTLQFRLDESAAALARGHWPTPASTAPSLARWSRRYGEQHRRASGRHRPVPAQVLAAQLAHRPRAQPGLSRALYDDEAGRPTTPRARRCCRASRAGGCR